MSTIGSIRGGYSYCGTESNIKPRAASARPSAKTAVSRTTGSATAGGGATGATALAAAPSKNAKVAAAVPRQLPDQKVHPDQPVNRSGEGPKVDKAAERFYDLTRALFDPAVAEKAKERSWFGKDRGDPRPHRGTDIGGVPEGTPIHSPVAGRVAYEVDDTFGNHVHITPNKEGSDASAYTIAICHMQYANGGTSKDDNASGPMEVKAGDVIGVVGNTGKSDGSHVHIEVVDASGQYVNALTLPVASPRTPEKMGPTPSGAQKPVGLGSSELVNNQ